MEALLKEYFTSCQFHPLKRRKSIVSRIQGQPSEIVTRDAKKKKQLLRND